MDSILAVKIIQELGIDVRAIHFVTPFFSKKEGKDHIKKVADELGFKLKVIPLGEDYVAMVKQPKFGYGKNINPALIVKSLCSRRQRQ